MTLRVGIDATAWRNERGDGRFVRNAVKALVAEHPDVGWMLYGDRATASATDLPPGAELLTVRQGRIPADALVVGSARRPLDLIRLSLAVRRHAADVFLSPSVVSYFPVTGVPSVVGIHDATTATHPHLVLPAWRDRLRWRAKRTLALRRADRLFTVSDSARAAICGHFAISPGRVAVVPEAPDPCFAAQPDEAVDAALDSLGLSRKAGYFVFAAGVSPHKGLDTLLDAYAMLRERRPAVPPLVIAGSHQGPYPSAIEAVADRVAALGLEGTVTLPGFVADRFLACLYTGAIAAIVPSLSEGFGLAAVEAAACGVPVVLSDLGAHRETLGEAALFFPPGDAVALRDRLEVLVDEPRERNARGFRAREAAARLSWQETARGLFGLLVAAAENGRS